MLSLQAIQVSSLGALPVGGIAAGIVAAAGLVSYLLLFAVQFSAGKAGWIPSGFPLLRRLGPPLCLFTASLAARLVLPELRPKLEVSGAWLSGLSAAAVVAAALLLIQAVNGLRHWLYARFEIDTEDNLRARRIRTQLGFLEKLIDVLIVVLALAAALSLFEGGRRIGASLLASAGVASLLIGFAAQRSISNLIAGFQIAFTQPIRLDDAVVVEDEWGWVEEITLTYVVVRIWDLRRLVLPITYFVEKPFQNWTRTLGQILGSVMFEVSHHAPVDAIEAELFRLLDASKLWDRGARVLQVVEMKEHSMTLRALMTAKNSPTCWDLRCEIRRGVIDFLVKRHPDALPAFKLRQLGASGEGGKASSAANPAADQARALTGISGSPG